MENRIPTLDGWRAVAILMVLAQHSQAAFHTGLSVSLGQHGVQIFFILSGYLITTQLIRRDHIDLRAFYLRRVFRIVPAATVYISVLVALATLTRFKTCSPHDVLACLLFFRNYLMETPLNTCTGQFWSLSLEEQFYLVWPAVLVFLGLRRAALAATGCIVAVVLLRWFAWSYYMRGLNIQHTEVRADGLLIGCLLALALNHAIIRDVFQKHFAHLFWPALVIVLVDIHRFHQFAPIDESLALACLIGGTSLCPSAFLGKLLEARDLKIIGTLSYSIYIWQGLFLRSNWGVFGPLLLASAVLVSYFLVEAPFRHYGRNLARTASAQQRRAA